MILRLAIPAALMLLILFAAAGRADLPMLWAYAGMMLTGLVLVALLIDRDLLRERIRPAPGGEDRHLRTVGMILFPVHLLVAGLDAGRFHWSSPAPLGVRFAALGVQVASLAVAVWAMRTNRFFSPVVRIQSERGHTLVTGGPYRFVRHPGYAASILGWPCAAIVIGSWWCLVPLVPLLVLLFRRTIHEDRFLHNQLPGYREYARRVRWRLLPGLW